MLIRPETVADRAAIAEVVERAFGAPAEARLVEAIRASPEYIAELALVAAIGERIVGHVMISRCRLVDDASERQIVLLAPLAVEPAQQRRGVGSALVRAVTELADRRGEPFVVLEGDPAYYSRFGFEPASEHGISLPLAESDPPEAGQVLRLSHDDPDVRGRVVYPAAFELV